jgi:hypothetical protein
MSQQFLDLDGTLVNHMLWNDDEYLSRRFVPEALRREIGRLFAWDLFVRAGYESGQCQTASRGYCAVKNGDCGADADLGVLTDTFGLKLITHPTRLELISELEQKFEAAAESHTKRAEQADTVSLRHSLLYGRDTPLPLRDFYLLGVRIGLVFDGLTEIEQY